MRKPWQRPVVRADNTDPDSISEPEPDSTGDETAETTAPRSLTAAVGEVQ